MPETDQKIIADLKDAGKRDLAFHVLVKTYQERLYWHIRKMAMNHDDADDILQNTFMKVWRSIDSFREESSLYTWLYRIATNESITFLNSKKKKNLMSLNEDNEYLMDNLMSDPYFDGDEIQIKLQKAILRLPEKQRIVFNLRYYEEMKYEEMAKVLETSVGALKASFHHAAKKVEKYIRNTD